MLNGKDDRIWQAAKNQVAAGSVRSSDVSANSYAIRKGR
jgi:hypothetical protein